MSEKSSTLTLFSSGSSASSLSSLSAALGSASIELLHFAMLTAAVVERLPQLADALFPKPPFYEQQSQISDFSNRGSKRQPRHASHPSVPSVAMPALLLL